MSRLETPKALPSRPSFQASKRTPHLILVSSTDTPGRRRARLLPKPRLSIVRDAPVAGDAAAAKHWLRRWLAARMRSMPGLNGAANQAPPRR